LDKALKAEVAEGIARHLSECPQCRGEYEKLRMLHDRLRSLPRMEPPPYLRRLIEMRIANVPRQAWHVRLREEIERLWSIIRTLESTWYITRALGTVAASILFLLITYTIHPIYPSPAAAPLGEKVAFSADYGQQVGRGVLVRLGMIPSRPQIALRGRQQPAIHDLYFLNYGMSIPKTGNDDSFSVVTLVEPTGVAKIQNILEYPSDRSLLASFVEMISSARCRPATRNGEAVASHLVLMFSKVTVYD